MLLAMTSEQAKQLQATGQWTVQPTHVRAIRIHLAFTGGRTDTLTARYSYAALDLEGRIRKQHPSLRFQAVRLPPVRPTSPASYSHLNLPTTLPVPFTVRAQDMTNTQTQAR